MLKLVGGTITVGLITLLALLFIGSAVVRFQLVTINPAFWLFALGIIFTLGGGWLFKAKLPGGKMFATLGTVLILTGGYKSIWPNTAKASAHAQQVADEEVARALNNAVSSKVIRCDRESKTEYWDAVTGKAMVFFILNEETRRFECTDRKGFHPETRQEYLEVTKDIVKLIAKQDPPEEPNPVVPEPVQVAISLPATQMQPTPTTIPLVPVVQPTPEPTPEPTPKPVHEYTIESGETITVELTEPLDLGKHGEQYQFDGVLARNITDYDGVVLAHAGTPVGMMISRVQLDPETSEALLELEVTTLTTPCGKKLSATARHRAIPIQPVRAGIKKNMGRSAVAGAALGALVGGIRGGKRDATRYGAAGAVAGAGVGAALTENQYILAPERLRLKLIEPWVVPAVMLIPNTTP